MAAIIKKLYANILLAIEYQDVRTAHLPMLSSPIPVMCILGAYLYFVQSWGPRFMRNRERFELKGIMMIYNAAQVVGCAYLFEESWRLGWGWGRPYSYFCQPLDMAVNERNFEIGQCVYLYFLMKLVDLLDTVFMVLRKNFRQVTFLHLYHHAGMAAVTWIGARFVPGGHHTALGFHNCFVHVIMYSYYLGSLIDPSLKQVWWKKYITVLQIIQFGVNTIVFTLPFFQPKCEVNWLITGALFVQNVYFFLMFSDFYWKTYVRKPQKNNLSNSKNE